MTTVDFTRVSKAGYYDIPLKCASLKKAVNIRVTVRGLVTCPNWRKCEDYGKGDCAVPIIERGVVEQLKKKKKHM